MRLKKFINPSQEWIDNPDKNEYPFKNNEIVLYMGEIENMPEHCVVVTSDGRVFWGFHSEDFVDPSTDSLYVDVRV